jgi:hypothetical protein
VQIRVTRFPLHRPFLIWALALLIADVLIRRFLLGSYAMTFLYPQICGCS